MLPDPIKKFVEVFSRLPSIGPRQATRLAFYISNLGKNKIKEIGSAIYGLTDLTTCSRCFRTFTGSNPSARTSSEPQPNSSRSTLCSICQDSTRNKGLIAVVEKETDLMSLEKTKKFGGWYLVLGELHKSGDIEPEQKLRLTSLKNVIKKEMSGLADEIILALNPTMYGDVNAALIRKELEGYAKKITRLGRGIPTGGEIEFADEDTLGSALEKRS